MLNRSRRRRQDLLKDGLERLDLCLGADVRVDLVLVDLLVAGALWSTLITGVRSLPENVSVKVLGVAQNSGQEDLLVLKK